MMNEKWSFVLFFLFLPFFVFTHEIVAVGVFCLFGLHQFCSIPCL